MTNIRKIIIKQSNNEKFERNPNKVSIYTKRTEQEILNDFETLGYQIPVNNEKELSIGFQTVNGWFGINIYKYAKSYEVYEIINATRYSVSLGIQEHKLLNELFEVIFDEC